MPHMAHDFSNSAIIDYRPGLNFSSMLANKQPDFMTTGSEYKVNLDNNGHTVNMQIQPAKIAAPLAGMSSANAPVFLSNEQIAHVASRIASELCGKPVLETEAALLAPVVPEAVPPHIARQLEVMKHRIDALQKELKFDAVPGELSRAAPQPIMQQAPLHQPAPLQASRQSLEAENSLHIGLRHHTDILRETQRKIDALESDMSYVLGVSTDHAQCLDLMDAGLRNQKAEIESSHAMTRFHNEQLSENQERMLSYETDVAEHRADSLQLQEECLSSVSALRDEYNTQSQSSDAVYEQLHAVDAGLQNHRNEIRALRSEYAASAISRSAHEQALAASQQHIASTQRQLSEMDSGLTNHQTQIRSLKQDMQTQGAAMNSNFEEQRGKLRTVQSGMQSSNSTLSAGLQNHKDEIRSLRSDVAQQRQGVDALRAQQNQSLQSSQSLNTLSAGLQHHKEEIRSLRSDAAQQRHGVEAMRAQQSQSAQSIQSMQSVQSVQSMQAHAAIPAQSQLQNLQSQIDALQNSIIMSQVPSQGRVATNVSRGDLSAFLQTRAQR